MRILARRPCDTIAPPHYRRAAPLGPPRTSRQDWSERPRPLARRLGGTTSPPQRRLWEHHVLACTFDQGWFVPTRYRDRPPFETNSPPEHHSWRHHGLVRTLPQDCSRLYRRPDPRLYGTTRRKPRSLGIRPSHRDTALLVSLAPRRYLAPPNCSRYEVRSRNRLGHRRLSHL